MKIKSIQRKTNWTAEDRARHKELRERLKKCPTPEQLVASGDYSGPVSHGLVLEMMQTLARLRQLREAAGMSLADVARRSGIDKSAVSRLENGHFLNPTIDTLCRYATAVGKRIVWTLKDPLPSKAAQGNSKRR